MLPTTRPTAVAVLVLWLHQYRFSGGWLGSQQSGSWAAAAAAAAAAWTRSTVHQFPPAITRHNSLRLHVGRRRLPRQRISNAICQSASTDDTTSSSASSSKDDDDGKGEEEWTNGASSTSRKRLRNSNQQQRQLELMWCSKDYCKDAVREKVVGDHNQILLYGPATGQVAYHWCKPCLVLDDDDDSDSCEDDIDEDHNDDLDPINGKLAPTQQNRRPVSSVLLMVKQGDDELLRIAAQAVRALTNPDGPTAGEIAVLLEPTLAARLMHYHGVGGAGIHLFEPKPTPGFGDHLRTHHVEKEMGPWNSEAQTYLPDYFSNSNKKQQQQRQRQNLPAPCQMDGDDGNCPSAYYPDLICTLGGDGLLMHAGMIFQGPTPPILCVGGGSLGFLTPFHPDEMVAAIQIALGVIRDEEPESATTASTKTARGGGAAPWSSSTLQEDPLDVFPPNMPSYPYNSLQEQRKQQEQRQQHQQQQRHRTSRDPVGSTGTMSTKTNFSFGWGDCVCLSIRMRLECRIMNRDGMVRSRYNVLNEVVIDRGSSPYLSALECFCDDVHLTTVQADGVIFATPTGSTAYSLAAGSSVVHPAVPCILVTPICPHVLSFRSMVLPDHVVLHCYVPEDARAEAAVAFDGKHRQALHRGDAVQIQMSPFPVPTINRVDHSADWLWSLKSNFNFNARPRQRPLN